MKKVMIKAIAALGIILASVLYSIIWLIRFNIFVGYNFESLIFPFPFPFGHSFFILFYSFGIYINSAIFRLFSKRERELVPLILTFTAFASFQVSNKMVNYMLIVGRNSTEKRLRIWGIFLLIQLVVLTAASYLENKENIRDFDVKIAIALLINLILFVGLSTLVNSFD